MSNQCICWCIILSESCVVKCGALFLDCLTLEMKPPRSFEKSESVYQTTRRHDPERFSCQFISINVRRTGFIGVQLCSGVGDSFFCSHKMASASGSGKHLCFSRHCSLCICREKFIYVVKVAISFHQAFFSVCFQICSSYIQEDSDLKFFLEI